MAASSSSPQALPIDKHDQKLAILGLFAEDSDTLSSSTIAERYQLPDNPEHLVGLLKSLQGDGVITYQTHTRTIWRATEEGERYLAQGSPEYLVLQAVRNSGDSGLNQAAVEQAVGKAVASVGWGQCLRLNWTVLDKQTKVARAGSAAPSDDVTSQQLRTIQQLSELADDSGLQAFDQQVLANLKRRSLLTSSVVKSFTLLKTATFARDLPRPIKKLTLKVLEDGDWKSRPMKPFNLNSRGLALSSGYLHPLMKMRTRYTQIFLDMGFAQMPTAQYVENSFWNFDALFQPQQHPARDAHDTFFIADPARTTEYPPDYLARVKAMHESGGSESIGWRYDWSLEEAQKNILRTHTTAISARMLYELGQEYARTGVFTPKKYFSIDKVYRNEALDATHLAEFHQIEGLIADRDLTLGHLIGVLKEFFTKLGITQLRFKPAYNPYTEPSMEVFSFHEGLDKWVEIGNSGMFRPEMLLPMGLPPDVGVIAWGLSLERPTMIKYHLQNIRDLVGHNLDLNFCRHFPIIRD